MITVGVNISAAQDFLIERQEFISFNCNSEYKHLIVGISYSIKVYVYHQVFHLTQSDR